MTKQTLTTQIMNAILPFMAWATVTTSGVVKIKGKWVTLGHVRSNCLQDDTGLSDIIGQTRLLYGGLSVALEVKEGKDVVTAEQQYFIDNVIKHGGRAGVVRSIDEALAIVRG